MPEGDTAWRTARLLHDALAGDELTRSDFRVPAFATLDLTGQRVDEAVSRGKHLLLRVGRHSIHTHLKMEGAWRVYQPGERWRRPAHTARVVLETSARQAVGFSLGITEVLDRQAEPQALSHLGPDLLGPDWDLDEAVRRVTADPRPRCSSRCTTSATSQDSATSTSTSCASCPVCCRPSRSRTSKTSVT